MTWLPTVSSMRGIGRRVGQLVVVGEPVQGRDDRAAGGGEDRLPVRQVARRAWTGRRPRPGAGRRACRSRSRSAAAPCSSPLMGASPRRWWVSSAQQPSLMYQSPAPTGQESTGAVCFATSTVPTTNSACTGAAPGGWIAPTTRCSSRSGGGPPSGTVTSSQTTDVLDGAKGAPSGRRVVGFPARVDELRDVGGERRPGFRRIAACVAASRMSTRSSWNGIGRAFVSASSYARCVSPSVPRTGAGVVYVDATNGVKRVPGAMPPPDGFAADTAPEVGEAAALGSATPRAPSSGARAGRRGGDDGERDRRGHGAEGGGTRHRDAFRARRGDPRPCRDDGSRASGRTRNLAPNRVLEDQVPSAAV